MTLSLQGCSTAGYYLQAVEGHLDIMERAQAARARRRDFIALVTRYRKRLADFYALPGRVEEKVARKRKLFDAMRADYQTLKQRRTAAS